jgi:hypothetical protein
MAEFFLISLALGIFKAPKQHDKRTRAQQMPARIQAG